MKLRTVAGILVALGWTAWLFVHGEPSNWKILAVPYLGAALIIDPSDFKDLVTSWKEQT